jgi:hypothetical protein
LWVKTQAPQNAVDEDLNKGYHLKDFDPQNFKKNAAGFCSFSEASMNEMAWWMSAKWPPG